MFQMIAVKTAIILGNTFCRTLYVSTKL